MRARITAALLVGLALALVGCSDANETADDEVSGELTVYAAASLSGAFDQLAADFEAAHPGTDVLPITYDGSSVLTAQLLEGASADVFASADERTMAQVATAGLADEAAPFARNTLEIAVAPANPHDVTGLESLTSPALITVLCTAEVPCGHAAETLLVAAGVSLSPASEEQNVTAVLSKVKSGEADAGLVYRTDIQAAGSEVAGVEITGADRAANTYPIVSLTDAPHPALAAAFVDYVLSPAGQRVLASFGFGAP